MNYSGFEAFCGGAFWNSSLLLDNSWPQFTDCFINTALVWIPCGYVWLLLPYFLYDVNNEFSTNNLHPTTIVSRRKNATRPVYSSEGNTTLHGNLHQLVDSSNGKFTAVCLVKIILTCLLAMLALIHLLLDSQDHQSTAEIVSSTVYLATYILIVFQLWYERRKGRIAVFISFYFYLMNILLGIIPLYTWIITKNYQSHPEQFGLLLAVLVINIVCFVLTFVPDNPVGNEKGYQQMDWNSSPEALAPYPSRLLFFWFLKMMRTAFRKEITEEDVLQLNPSHQGRLLNPMFEYYWEEEVERSNRINAGRFSYTNFSSDRKGQIQNGTDTTKNQVNGSPSDIGNGLHHRPDQKDNENSSLLRTRPYKIFGTWTSSQKVQTKLPSLFRVLGKLEWKNALSSFTKKVSSDVILFTGPMILGAIVEILQSSDDKKIWQAYALLIVLFLTVIARSTVFTNSKYACSVLGLHVKTVLLSAIYKKALFLSNSARQGFAAGEIVNLMSVDCQRLQELLSDCSFFVTCPFQILIAVVLLYVAIGPSMIAGICVLALAVPINSWFIARQKVIQEAVLKLKDKRIKIVNETLNSIKVLKLYAWEDEFMKRVETIRAGEIKQLSKVAVLLTLSETTMGIIPYLCSVATYVTYVLIDRNNVLDAKVVFVSLSLFNLLRLPVLSVKILITHIVQIYASLTRIHKFLLTESLDFSETNFSCDTEHTISVTDGTFTWEPTLQPTLWNIHVRIACGQLTAIVGPVGSGKSSLISAILGEMDKIRGQVTVKGTVAYVSQQAWIQNATIRENILFGAKFNKDRYMQVIKACELERDLEILDAGDQTEIGEKGINLSGGQKQRVSVARAVYSDSDIYLLDDPLSAVDAHVGKAIFKNIIGSKGMLAKKTRVLVTHGIQWLSQVDHILVLNKGVITEQGSFNELVSHNGPFAKFLQEYLMDTNIQSENSEELTSDEEEDHTIKSAIQMVKLCTRDTAANNSDNCTKTDKPEKLHVKNCENSLNQLSGITDLRENTKTLAPIIDGLEGKLIVDETLKTGKVTIDVFLTFGRAAGLCSLLTAFVFFILNRGAMIWSIFFITEWTKDPLVLNATMLMLPEGAARLNYYLIVYGGVFSIAQLITLITYCCLFWFGMVRAAKTLHHLLLKRLFHAPMSFFDQTPIGRILNRFSKDVDTVDSTLPTCLNDSLVISSFVLMVIVIVLIQSPIVACVIVPVCIVFIALQRYHSRTVRQLKRIESITRSPVFTHLSESFTGAAVIRAYRATERFIEELEQKVDKNQTVFFGNQLAYCWLQIALDFLGNVVILLAAIFSITSGGGGSDIGLSISSTMQLAFSMTYMVRQVNDFESSIVAVERIKEYSQVEQEAELINPDRRPPPSWPFKGDVTFIGYQTRYREGLDLVLKGINCHINGGEKIGIVGRTGAGKSSLTLSLFRMIEAVSGKIIIDGINIADIGLNDLRSSLTVLPQDPVIFSGSLRTNIDPFEQYTDDQLWAALERSHLKAFVAAQPERLHFECGHEGSNLSVGQRQLVCLARALLRHTKILILDEATAAVDMETDAIIQKAIREAFDDCTVLAIAHRLNTIMDYDRIIVMDAGVISEFDTPNNLVNSKGMFYSMCKDAGLV